jgi:uncharacterized protein (TIGR01319 family)
MTEDSAFYESILALDCGSTTTQALLIEHVQGTYRLVARTEAPSTLEPPWSDVVASARQATRELSEIIGLPLLNERGNITSPQQYSGGVDAVVIVCSAAEPVRLLLAGVMGDISLASARRAFSTTYAVVEGCVSLDGHKEGAHCTNNDIQGQIDLIQKLQPDAIVIVGGIDGGAAQPILQAAKAAAIGSFMLPQSDRPTIVFAGNAELRTQVAEIIGAEAELRSVDNIRPSLELENPAPLRSEIERLYREKKMERLPGFGTLASWSPVTVLPSAKAFAYTIQYLAESDGINVMGVDVGGGSATIAAVVDETLDMAVRGDLGLSYNASRILDHVPIESICRWLPFAIEAVEIENILHNKAIRYRTVPQTREELLLEQAVAREILRLMANDMMHTWTGVSWHLYPALLPKFHLVVGSGGLLANTATYGQAALILLDALQPVGVTGIALDRLRLLAPLAATAMISPVAAAQVLERDALLNLGTVVAPIGLSREGDTALTFKIEYEDGRSLQVEVPFGSLEVIPLSADQTATLELRPSRHFDVGLGTKGQAGMTKVEGGVIGIIIDARGRPLPTADNPEIQRQRMQRWLWDVGS